MTDWTKGELFLLGPMTTILKIDHSLSSHLRTLIICHDILSLNIYYLEYELKIDDDTEKGHVDGGINYN